MRPLTAIALLAALCALTACDTGDTPTASDTPGAEADIALSSDAEVDVAERMDVAMGDTPEGDVPTGPEADVASGPEVTVPVETAMTVQLINAATGGAYSGVSVSTGAQQEVTNASGQASVVVTEGAYRVTLEASDARAHHLFGVAGDAAFTQISYMSPDSVTLGVFGAVGLVDDPARGTLVVGLDTPSLAPAVGASAAIDSASDPAFIFAGFAPQPGATIPAGGQSFVTFPNVTAGPVEVSASLPGGACLPFPARSGDPQIEVYPGEVSVVAYICR